MSSAFAGVCGGGGDDGAALLCLGRAATGSARFCSDEGYQRSARRRAYLSSAARVDFAWRRFIECRQGLGRL